MTTIQARTESPAEIEVTDSDSRGRAGTPASPTVTAAAVPSLRTRAIRGSLWTIGGHGARYGLRLAGNLVLTRVLFPEAFGLMALVYVVLNGLEMFSDVGVQGSVIRDKRGDEPSFLNTAWTIGAVRGMALWLCASLLAWPAARLYGEPLLALMIPVAGLSSVLRGFSSIAVLTCQRHVQVRPLVLRDLVGGVLGLVVTVALAIQLRSV
ncbi:MAG: oligosaccharide flippase family protein, partial [Phycisphaerales bacterium]